MTTVNSRVTRTIGSNIPRIPRSVGEEAILNPKTRRERRARKAEIRRFLKHEKS